VVRVLGAVETGAARAGVGEEERGLRAADRDVNEDAKMGIYNSRSKVNEQTSKRSEQTQ
jgi:hypothetical protein